MVMRLRPVLGLILFVAAGCGQSSEQQAVSAQSEVLPSELGRGPSRALSPELPGDDPTFSAATDAFDPEVLEQRTMELTGLRSDDLGGGYFGQRFFQSFWTEATPDMAMAVCHELVTYANELDFPATEIVVRQKSYKDLQSTQNLVVVDDTGYCVAVTG